MVYHGRPSWYKMSRNSVAWVSLLRRPDQWPSDRLRVQCERNQWPGRTSVFFACSSFSWVKIWSQTCSKIIAHERVGCILYESELWSELDLCQASYSTKFHWCVSTWYWVFWVASRKESRFWGFSWAWSDGTNRCEKYFWGLWAYSAWCDYHFNQNDFLQMSMLGLGILGGGGRRGKYRPGYSLPHDDDHYDDNDYIMPECV